ncbi:TMIG2 protein, partial [Pluvianellus socialis]|nr:TMIG2 protein [Pluvianellus socialis]
ALLFPAVGALQVSQDPDKVQVTAGDKVALECHVLVAESWDLLRLEWVKDAGNRVLCATRLYHRRVQATTVPPSPCPPRLHLDWQPPCATLSLLQVQGDDAGRYLCRVTLEI